MADTGQPEQAPAERKASYTIRFVGELSSPTSRGKVKAALGAVLEHPSGTLYDEQRVIRGLSSIINGVDSIESQTPGWISASGIVGLVAEITSTQLWEPLVQSAHSHIREGMNAELDAARRSGSIGGELAGRNSSFVTAAIVSGLYAAAMGQDVKYIFMRQKILNVEFAHQIGGRYGSPPRDREEFMQRVAELIPDPDRTDAKGRGTLIDYLITNNAFTSPKNQGRCPANQLTQILIEQWGRILHQNPEYRARFENTVFRRSRSVDSRPGGSRDIIDFSIMTLAGLRLLVSGAEDPANREAATRELESRFTDGDSSSTLNAIPGFTAGIIDWVNAHSEDIGGSGIRLRPEDVRFGISFNRRTFNYRGRVNRNDSYTLHVWGIGDADQARTGIDIERKDPADFAQLAFPRTMGDLSSRRRARDTLLSLARQARERIEPPQMTQIELDKFIQTVGSFTASELIAGHELAEAQLPTDAQKIQEHVWAERPEAESAHVLNPIVATARREIKSELISQVEAELLSYPKHALRSEIERVELKLRLLRSISELDLEDFSSGIQRFYRVNGRINGCPLRINKSVAWDSPGGILDRSDDHHYKYSGNLGRIGLDQPNAYGVFETVRPILNEINRMAMIRLYSANAEQQQ